MTLRVLAPAKVNLYLHVVGRRADGYHLLDSLVAFADIGDWLSGALSDRLSLEIEGPERAGLSTLGDDNLVMRAARLLAEHAAPGPRGATLRLDKHLPISSGIGGGSSDAAAAWRLLARLWDLPPVSAKEVALAADLGADVPACLAGRPVWVGGIGERLEPAHGLPPVGIVLANPRVPLPTAKVFQSRQGAFGAAGRFSAMPWDAAELATLLRERRNDLEQPALTLVPEVASVLDRLGTLQGALLARMSGSGATCFALFEHRGAALAAARQLADQEPAWWSAGGVLLSAPPSIINEAD